MIDTVRRLGRSHDTPPKIYILVPPPLMEHGSIGANQTVINSVYSKLIPMIKEAAGDLVVKAIDIFHGMGGENDWATDQSGRKNANLIRNGYLAGGGAISKVAINAIRMTADMLTLQKFC